MSISQGRLEELEVLRTKLDVSFDLVSSLVDSWIGMNGIKNKAVSEMILKRKLTQKNFRKYKDPKNDNLKRTNKNDEEDLKEDSKTSIVLKKSNSSDNFYTMKVTKLQLGVYANRQPFCLYLFPLVATPPSPSRTTVYQLFYRLRDIDVIFFESQIGFIYNSGKIPQIYFDTPGYCFYERSGDIYLAARAISETGTRLGNHLLAEFCKYGRSDIISGMADKLLESVDISRASAVEAEFEFFTADSSFPLANIELPPISRKRMSLDAVLDKNDNTNYRYASPVEHTVSPSGSDRETPIKQEPYSESEHSNSSPNNSPKSPHSPSSPLLSGEVAVEEETRTNKRRRVVASAIGSNNIKVTNNPEVMEQLKDQQTHLQETHHKRNSVSNRSNRNSRNLSVFAPPYNDGSIVVSSASSCVNKVRGQNSAGLKYHVQSPMTAPISLNRSAQNRQSVSGFPLSANSAFLPTSQSLNTHSASTSASINGLISPNNIDDVRSGRISSPLPSPHPSRISMPVTNPALHSNGEQPSKKSFIRLFDSFYDTVADTRSLKTTLEDQIRKTTTLLQTLQASGSMIESLVRGHFREMQREVVNDLMTLEKRLSKVEERIRNSAAVVGMGPSPPLDPDRRLSDISTACSDIGLSHNNQDANNNLSVSQLTNSSPPLSAVSSSNGYEDSQTKDYEDILSGLKARLESLERRISVS
ncbi:3004_t:CDS:2 [Funneliformis geosporum]|uniref:3004_t:CDS:1 n=1 Tax=Funneliformis geosporum TaxID=1117311 RepID=A0A9W4SQ69_9GLOM|nr:3004_t:CDS:2 [Funneliformis geosporum]